MEKYVPIGKAAEILGVSISTLRRWVNAGKIEAETTEGRHRRFEVSKLKPGLGEELSAPRRAVAYARVSSPGQQDDMKRQQEALELFCAKNGWEYELVTDIGSGVNVKNRGLQRVIDLIMADRVSRLVVTHRDRLLRIGCELLFALCSAKDVKVVVLNRGVDTIPEKDLAQEVMELQASS